MLIILILIFVPMISSLSLITSTILHNIFRLSLLLITPNHGKLIDQLLFAFTAFLAVRSKRSIKIVDYQIVKLERPSYREIQIRSPSRDHPPKTWRNERPNVTNILSHVAPDANLLCATKAVYARLVYRRATSSFLHPFKANPHREENTRSRKKSSRVHARNCDPRYVMPIPFCTS